MDFVNAIKELASVDIFKECKQKESFIGRPFYLDYEKANLLICDKWKYRVNGVPQGTFLLAFYENEDSVEEALLLRALKPSKLPTDNDVISSMIQYYQDNLKTTGKESSLDDFTKYYFSFSGLECRILGTFYKDTEGNTIFGADVENFYSAHHYSVYKPQNKVLEKIVNLNDEKEVSGQANQVKIGVVRYSSSQRFQNNITDVSVYISPKDFLGKRTALFGMTRTGKSNTVKKIIESTVNISKQAKEKLPNEQTKDINPFIDGSPKYPVGQIIFDINGEYANANMQDKGTAIFELYNKDYVIRYSVLDKSDDGFRIMKINFYNEISSGFDLVRSHLSQQNSAYIKSFCSIDLTLPDNYFAPIQDKSSEEKLAAIAYDRKKALYQCCLHAAGFKASSSLKVKFYGDAEGINNIVPHIKPHERISLDQATEWFTEIFNASESSDQTIKEYFSNYKKKKEKDFIDEDMKALMVFLTRKQTPTSAATYSGFRLLRDLKDLHTDTADTPFEEAIITALHEGKIVIIDLSQGNPEIQKLYSERICKKIFENSMSRFISTKPNNFIQFYFEEAHNLFPKKEDKDLSQIYNRIAKEGAKLNLGMTYATQEVSSISANILKNTQNWFIAHLNNDDELKELKKYYDFIDFSDSLIRFSASSDKGFVRMKNYSNPFVVPVQIDLFLANKGE